MFRTKYDSYEISPTCSGTSFENDYKMKVFDDGSRDLVAVGTIDIYSKIQSFKDSVDLKLVLERYARGDESAIYRRHAFFGDFTHMPTSLSELSQRILDANDLFNNLDVEVRREFDFDAGKFFASIGTEKFNQIASKFNPDGTLIDKPILNVDNNAVVSTTEPTVKPVPVDNSSSAKIE